MRFAKFYKIVTFKKLVKPFFLNLKLREHKIDQSNFLNQSCVFFVFTLIYKSLNV